MTKANQTEAPATSVQGQTASADPSRAPSAPNAPAAASAARPSSGSGTARAVAGAPAEAKPVRALQPARMTLQVAGQCWNVWDVVAEIGTPPEWLLSEEYWTHVGAKLAVWDEIIVRVEDGSAKYRLTVQAAGKRYARVAIESGLRLSVGGPGAMALPPGYGVEWAGPHCKFRVRRGADVLKDGFDTEGEANQWLGRHLRAA